MKTQIQMKQRIEKKERKSLPVRVSCPKCRSKRLLNEGMDQFCCDCDWDTCIEYVELGLMNNLEVAFKEHFLKPARDQHQSNEISEQNILDKSA